MLNVPLPRHAAEAERAEVLHEPELGFGCTIMVLGLQVRPPKCMLDACLPPAWHVVAVCGHSSTAVSEPQVACSGLTRFAALHTPPGAHRAPARAPPSARCWARSSRRATARLAGCGSKGVISGEGAGCSGLPCTVAWPAALSCRCPPPHALLWHAAATSWHARLHWAATLRGCTLLEAADGRSSSRLTQQSSPFCAPAGGGDPRRGAGHRHSPDLHRHPRPGALGG